MTRPLEQYRREVRGAYSWRKWPAKERQRLADAQAAALRGVRERRGEAAMLRHARRVMLVLEGARAEVELETRDPELELGA